MTEVSEKLKAALKAAQGKMTLPTDGKIVVITRGSLKTESSDPRIIIQRK